MEAATRGMLAELRGGLAEVRERSWVVAFLALFATHHAVVLPAVVLGPVLAEREYGGASSWAVVVAAFGVGAITGDLLVLPLTAVTGVAVSVRFTLWATSLQEHMAARL